MNEVEPRSCDEMNEVRPRSCGRYLKTKKTTMRAKKSLGQNFLTSKAVLRDIISASDISDTDVVLEIGPGKGFLTSEILQRSARVVAVEKDDVLVEFLKEKFENEIKTKKLILINEDILDFQPEKYKLENSKYKLIANIPYYLTGQIFRIFLESNFQPSKIVLMVQKEVAERVVARDGKESILSVSVKAYGVPHYIKKVSAKYFSPKPKVDSAVILIDKISKKFFSDSLKEQDFFKLIKTGFAFKRKVLLNNLSKTYEKQKVVEVFDVCGIPQKERAEKLEIKDWVCLLKNLN